MAVYCLKFDLTKSALTALPGLARRFRDEGAVRVSILVSAKGSWAASEKLSVATPSETKWNAIAVPSVEGTEFWLVAKSRQPEVDRAMGFAKPSQPIESIEAKTVFGLMFKDPLHGQSAQLEPGTDASSASPAGIEIATVQGDFSPEELERMRDHGSLAFELG